MKKLLGAIFIFTLSFCHGADKTGSPTEIIIDDVSGGLSTTLPSYKIQKQYSPYMRNVIIDNGKLEKPNGFKVAGSSMTLHKITAISPYYQETGDTSFLVSDSSIVLSTKDFNFYVFITSGLNTASIPRIKQIRNKMWIINGLDSPRVWDNTITTILDGTKGTPNVPKGKYIEYYQERVFLSNINGNASQSYYSDFKSTNGVAIAPDNFLAWPPTNLLNIGQGDGQVITGTWIEDGQLQYGKEASIYTLFGTNGSSYNPRKTSSIGVASGDSMVMMDDQANFLGNDGIYRARTRISDNIKNDVALINRDQSRILQNSWDSKTDFSRGQFFGTTATASGFLTNFTNYKQFNDVVKYQKPTPWNFGATLTSIYPSTPSTSLTDDASTYIHLGLFPPDFTPTDTGGRDIWEQGLRMFVRDIYLPCSGGNVNVTLKNFNTGEIKSTVISPTLDESINDMGFPQSPVFDYFEVKGGSIGVRLSLNSLSDTVICGADGPFTQDLGNWRFTPATTNQFLSEVSTLTSITAWGQFNSIINTNGGLVATYVRTSTSSVNISTQIWVPIGSGININAPTINNYVQWAATITSVSTNPITNIDFVSIDHIEGAGAINRAFGINWKSRYWLFTSTTTDEVFSLLYMKSKITNPNPDAFMPIEGINIRAVAKDRENTIYGGSSSTGIVYILDSGTNYNGSPIVSIYDTPDTYMGSPFNEKKLFEYYLTADKFPSKTLKIGLSRNGGSFTTNSYSLNGTGRYNSVIQNVQGDAKMFRWKFIQDQLDQGFDVTNFAVAYDDTGVRKGIGE